jgi:hypothetical protein
VDFPDPDAPISATISPGFTTRLACFNAGWPAPKDLLRVVTSIPAGRVSGSMGDVLIVSSIGVNGYSNMT